MALKDSLVSYWKLDEASGTRFDSHGSNDLTDNNTVGSATGKIGNCASFIAANSEYLSHADNADLSAGDIDFTFGCWVYFDTIGTFPFIVNKGWGDGSGWIIYVRIDDSNKLWFSCNADANTVKSAAVSTATWYHVVVRHDSVNDLIKITLNGTTTSASYSGGVTDDAELFILGGATFFLNGKIDEAFWAKRCWSDAEIDEIYNSGNGLSYDDWDAVVAGQPTVKRWGGIEYSPFAVGMSGIKRW